MMQKSDEIQYLIWSFEHHGWWRPYSEGYTPFKSEAGRYSLDTAIRIVQRSNIACTDTPDEAIVPDI